MSTSIPSLPSLPLLSLSNVPLSFTLPPSTSAITNTTGTALNPSTLRVPSSRSSRRPPPPTSSRGGRSGSRRSTPIASSSGPSASSRGTEGEAGRTHGTRAWAEANARGGLERALNGRLPFGMDLVQEERDLSDEEDEWEDKNQNICEFGHTFLIPFGFRKTQEELDAVQSRSPSPSPPSNAEDLNSGQDPIAQGGRANTDSSDTEEDPDEQPDLDADVEDADESVEASGEEEESNGSMASG